MDNDLLLREHINNLFRYLIDNDSPPFIDHSFWDPVKVTLSENDIIKLKDLFYTDDCIICSENVNYFKEMPCCKTRLCFMCTNKWFNESVHCPFCKKDIREII